MRRDARRRSPTTSRLGPVSRRPATNVGPALRPTTPMNTARPIGVEHPERRLGNAAERRPHRSQPPEDEAHDERAAAGREAERHAADVDRQQAEQPADEDAEADEDDVGLARSGVRCSRAPGPRARRPAGTPAMRSRSPRFEHGVRRRTESPRPPRTSFAQDHAAPVLRGRARRATGPRAPWSATTSAVDQRQVEQRRGLDLGAERASPRRAARAGAPRSPRRRRCEHVCRARRRTICALATDPLDEHALRRERSSRHRATRRPRARRRSAIRTHDPTPGRPSTCRAVRPLPPPGWPRASGSLP